ncbi:hypothetical protein [Rhodococcus sp. NPDC127528]|uniref:hypothetical protein n=1 Tax=unclassified Rhodococcus (in: high G+C Gram-positive bacteria) TaxID=192944 RepID=UPI00362D5EA7
MVDLDKRHRDEEFKRLVEAHDYLGLMAYEQSPRVSSRNKATEDDPPRQETSDPSPARFPGPMGFLRVPYEAMQFPLQLIEDFGISHLNQDATLRLAFERLLVDLDATAGRLLDDSAATARASALRQRSAAARITLALARRRSRQQQDTEAAADAELWRGHRERFRRRHQQYAAAATTGDSPPPLRH